MVIGYVIGVGVQMFETAFMPFRDDCRSEKGYDKDQLKVCVEPHFKTIFYDSARVETRQCHGAVCITRRLETSQPDSSLFS